MRKFVVTIRTRPQYIAGFILGDLQNSLQFYIELGTIAKRDFQHLEYKDIECGMINDPNKVFVPFIMFPITTVPNFQNLAELIVPCQKKGYEWRAFDTVEEWIEWQRPPQ